MADSISLSVIFLGTDSVGVIVRTEDGAIAGTLVIFGFASLPENMGVTNPFIYQAVVFGMLTVWPAYFLALLFRQQRHMSLFHWLIAGIELIWFFDVILLLYGLYVISPGR